MDIAPIIAELDRWPEPHRYRDAARPPVLFLQYSLVTGGAGYFIQRLADGLSDDWTVDVAGLIGRGGAVASRVRRARVVPCELPHLARHARWAGYRYVDAAFPLRDHHCEIVEAVLAACPSAGLGLRVHSEACFITHYITDRARALARRAVAIYCHHEAQRREVARVVTGGEPDGRWLVAPPGIDVGRFAPGGTDGRAVAEYRRRYDLDNPHGVGFRPRRLVVCMSGRPSEEKNWLDYLLIARRLKDGYGGAVVCLANTGPQRGVPFRKHLEALARFNADLGAPARVTGLLDDVENLYASVDVYLHTACSESLCRSAAEAAACGVPVVALAVGGLRHVVVQDGQTGFLVEPERGHRWLARLTARDREGLYRRVRDLLERPALRRRMGAAARRRACRRLSDADNTNWHRDILPLLFLRSH